MKRVMEEERCAAARTDPTFRPMRRKEALDSKMKRAMEDERFTAARTDPRFRPMRRKEAKVALDSRFAPMLMEPMFDSSEAPVDKRGRRRKKSARDNPMLHYYLNQEDGDEEKTEQEKLIRREGDHELEEEDGLEEEESSCSDDHEDDDEQYSVGCDIVHYLMSRHDDTPVIDKETHRLAVVNMDWDHIKAVDLYMVMTSCILKGGRVISVSIYPTEFGLKCMNIEATHGPSALIGADGDGADDDGGEDDNNVDDDDGEEDSDVDSETENNKLRTYELNKLREFKYPARDVAAEAPLSYKAPDFETPALQRTKVKPTWDDDEPERKILRQKFKHEFDGYAKYIASGESASEDDVDDSGDESLPNGVVKRKLTNEERLARLLQENKSDEERTDDRQEMEAGSIRWETVARAIFNAVM